MANLLVPGDYPMNVFAPLDYALRPIAEIIDGVAAPTNLHVTASPDNVIVPISIQNHSIWPVELKDKIGHLEFESDCGDTLDAFESCTVTLNLTDFWSTGGTHRLDLSFDDQMTTTITVKLHEAKSNDGSSGGSVGLVGILAGLMLIRVRKNPLK